jgi:hypothetical protein
LQVSQTLALGVLKNLSCRFFSHFVQRRVRVPIDRIVWRRG